MLIRLLKKVIMPRISKQAAELEFWQKEIEVYKKWFTGELSLLYRTPSPKNNEKVNAASLKDSSILTWHKLHQEVKYLKDLELSPNAFQGMKLLDIGSGPMPSATCFKGCQLYCLEPLLPKYLEIGFPLHYYQNCRFIHGIAENIPIEDNFFDAVISVNAIDHVDNMQETASEIGRVLKADGLLRMHMHYHKPRKCEPIEIDDKLFQGLFSWCGNLLKVNTSQKNYSRDLYNNGSFVLWSNF